MSVPPLVRNLGRREYLDTCRAMQTFTRNRGADTRDEIWRLEHAPVFTQGRSGRAEHVLAPGNIPVVASDRGGQVTYHGPGQVVIYLLLDIRRLRLTPRALVSLIEKTVMDLLGTYGIRGKARADAPGVYVEGAKIAALGLHISRGCSYHGLALNVDMDLEPFQRIDPCGMKLLTVTQMRALVPGISLADVSLQLGRSFRTAVADAHHRTSSRRSARTAARRVMNLPASATT